MLKKLKSSEFFHATGYLQKNHLSIPRLLDFPGYQSMIFLWVPYKCFFMCDSKALGVLRYKKLVYTPPMSAAVERFWILSYQQHNSKKGAILTEKASAVHLLRPNDVQRMPFFNKKFAPRGCALARNGTSSQATALGARVLHAELYIVALLYPVAVFLYLLSSINPVACVAKTRKNVAVFIEAFVPGTDVNIYVGMGIS